MASATKIRPLSRTLDACDCPLWVIGPTGKLLYVSAAAAKWLQVDGEKLIGRRCLAGAAISDDPLDYLAASLSPPPGFQVRGTARLRVQPPTVASSSGTMPRPTQPPPGIRPMEARFVRLGNQEHMLTVAIAGDFHDREGQLKPFDAATSTVENDDTVARRETLDRWRKSHAAKWSLVTAGDSPAARRIRARLQVATAIRTHLGIFGPNGSGRESIARQVHQINAPHEPLAAVDGPLMDAELLDASLAPLLSHLTGAAESRATALIRDLDEMPIEAQQRLQELLDAFPQRLRLIGLCGTQPEELSDPGDWSAESDPADAIATGLAAPLIDTLSALSVRLPALSQRINDIPILATAMLDRRHAAGEGIAQRIGRAALDALVIYPWPENIRELDQAIRHAVRASTSESIAVENLPLVIRSYRPSKPSSNELDSFPLDELVQKYESAIIEDMLRLCDGNRAETARRLGISRARLLRKIDQEIDTQET